ncbi:hypothetical protein OSB04_011968 [Centaurea solstitialis]|uniref:Uncharacterized protein n=1 Tax=Centaurea solstitialis TaxID=347529 RepID=A0AA38TAG4_9ASTR|nr:hypothetical protein OSB04_011968 [Centaurea solstitialis]
MTTPSQNSTLTSPTASQLVFALANVYSQFSFKLSTDGSKYKLWRRIFLDMCKGAKVHRHITGKSKPAGDDDEDWEAIDSRIKSWFYSTCDANLLQIISSDNCTAKDLWDKLDEFFLNNKIRNSVIAGCSISYDILKNHQDTSDPEQHQFRILVTDQYPDPEGLV